MVPTQFPPAEAAATTRAELHDIGTSQPLVAARNGKADLAAVNRNQTVSADELARTFFTRFAKLLPDKPVHRRAGTCCGCEAGGGLTSRAAASCAASSPRSRSNSGQRSA